MARAFVMIEVDTRVEPVRDAVAALDPVRAAHVVAGEFDVIAEAEAEAVYDLIDSAAGEIRDLGGVTDTRTYVCLE
jgi:DNA-binding Lrp family transcriptional regulator